MKFLSYPRTALMSLLYPLVLGGFSLTAILLNLFFNRRSIDDAVVRAWGRFSCFIFGVVIRAEGVENIPAGGAVFLFNHTSFFDIFALSATVPGIRFGAKIELFKIPVFGYAMRRLGILPIDRARREKVFKIYDAAQARLKNGERFALAPEGTRQDEEVLGQFKSGPFVFAINTGAPIVPVVIRNASRILPKHSILPNWGTWGRSVRVYFLPAVASTEYTIAQRPVLQEKVRGLMLPYFLKAGVPSF